MGVDADTPAIFLIDDTAHIGVSSRTLSRIMLSLSALCARLGAFLMRGWRLFGAQARALIWAFSHTPLPRSRPPHVVHTVDTCSPFLIA